MKKSLLRGFQVFLLIALLGILSFGEEFKAENDLNSEKVESSAQQFLLDADSFTGWNTFMGSLSDDEGSSIALDGDGKIHIAGNCEATWGSPISPYVGDYDVFVAKLNASGVLQWNTFLGSDSYDICYSIGVDGSGYVYVAGTSSKTWGTPLNPYTGGDETFLAKLNSSGNLQWNTFIGNDTSRDFGDSMAVDTSGNIYVTGTSTQTFGSPVNAWAGGQDAFIVKFDANGTVQWNTFMGSAVGDLGQGIDVDASGNVYVTGWSDGTWGVPINAYVANSDVFVAKLDNSGALQWNTFMGSSNWDQGSGIAVDGSGNIFVSGCTTTDLMGDVWDAIIAKFNNSGVQDWYSAMGCSGDDFGWDVAVDNNGYVYVAGMSLCTWGMPVNPFAGMADAYIAKLDSNGAWQWHTFMGSVNFDGCNSIAVDTNGSLFVGGRSDDTWGTPVNAHTGSVNFDAFVAKFFQEPEIHVRIAGINFPDGSTRNLGTRPPSLIMGREFTFTIENQGTEPLNLTGLPMVNLSGPQAAHFYISQQPTSPVGAYGTTTFKLRTVRDSLPGFLPIGWTYPVSITVNIPNDDDDENPYNFTLNFTLEKDS